MEFKDNRRILVIDDNAAIHADFQKTLIDPARESADFAGAEAALFDDSPNTAAASACAEPFELDFASQGAEGFAKLRLACEQKRPYALAFVDVRMPPGWDGVETIERLWQVDSELQTVICTAFADYSWQEMVARLGRSDRLLILKKPFDPIEVRQLASALTEKWNLSRREKLALLAARGAEQEARAYAASLETVNQALETSRKAAEAISQAKSVLLLNMARNLTGPMGAMLDVAEKIRGIDEAHEVEWLSNLGALCQDGSQLRRKLQDVLDLSELENGSLRLETIEFSPRELAKDAVAAVAGKAAARQLSVELQCSPEAPSTARSDAPRIRQILGHLLDNALEHTPAHGFVRLVLNARGVSSWQEPLLSFEVLDSGSGLTRDQEGLVFEPFCHTHDAKAAPGGHFGLGLSVSKRLAQRMGGDLTVEHAPGAGSRFVLTVKAALEVSAATQQPG